MDKGSINVFEVKLVRKDIGFKISAADVFNQFLYLGDEKGNIHSYPIRVGESDIISKSENDNSKNISKYKIDKILCYKEISTILVLTGETLIAVDSAFRRPEALASKVYFISLRLLISPSTKYSKHRDCTVSWPSPKRRKDLFLSMTPPRKNWSTSRTNSQYPKYRLEWLTLANLSSWPQKRTISH